MPLGPQDILDIFPARSREMFGLAEQHLEGNLKRRVLEALCSSSSLQWKIPCAKHGVDCTWCVKVARCSNAITLAHG